MSRDDLVRGKKRQRRKTPKTRSGCSTCKIRRVKCDEEKPSCLRCQSTGRICDFTNPSPASDSTTGEAESDHHTLVQSKTLPVGTTGTVLNDPAALSRDRILSRSPDHPTNPVLSIPVYTFRALPIPSSMSRAFEYFLRRTSVDIAGPLCVSVWDRYILSASVDSLAIQHSVAALSGIYEHQSYPKSPSIKANSECWKHYYLAVKAANKLVATVQDGSQNGNNSKEQLLIICSAFITIEVLLGNLEGALRHLEGCFSLLQTFFAKTHKDSSKSSHSGTSSVHLTHLNSHLADLIGFFVRLEIQILSFLPPKRVPVNIPTGSSLLTISQLSQPLPSVMSESLHRLIKQSLVWIRDYGSAFKYVDAVPKELNEAQAKLGSMLEDWESSHLSSQGKDRMAGTSGTTTHKIENTESANLLLAHQLTYLKVQTALSTSEHIFSTPSCLASFEAILECADIIVTQRNSNTSQDGNFAQLVSIFTLEMNTIDALYFTAIKCRQPSHRHRAVELLKRAGREGVWDGSTMAKIAAHVISMEEEDVSSAASSSHDSGLGTEPSPYSPSIDEPFLPPMELDDYFTSELVVLDPFLSSSPQSPYSKELINEVTFTIDQEESSVRVKCAWYNEFSDTWRSESTTLSLLD